MDRVAHHLAIALGIHLGTRGADHLGVLRHLTGAEPAKQAGKNLAAGQIARAAKHNQIKRVHRDDT